MTKNYLNNRDILAEIHKSKATYSSYLTEDDQNYDLIVQSVDRIEGSIAAAKEARIRATIYQETQSVRAAGGKAVELPSMQLTPDDIPTDSLVFRVMTYDHIPLLDPSERKKTIKSLKDHYPTLNFPPYQHYRYIDGVLRCVGKSHWEGGLENGHFSQTHGYTTEKLGSMYMLLIERIGRKGNWQGYTYLDEMKGSAIIQLADKGLYFDESRSDNPFAFYTTTVKRSFTRILNLEKRIRDTRDELLMMAGADPSFSRQIEMEMENWDRPVTAASMEFDAND